MGLPPGFCWGVVISSDAILVVCRLGEGHLRSSVLILSSVLNVLPQTPMQTGSDTAVTGARLAPDRRQPALP